MGTAVLEASNERRGGHVLVAEPPPHRGRPLVLRDPQRRPGLRRDRPPVRADRGDGAADRRRARVSRSIADDGWLDLLERVRGAGAEQRRRSPATWPNASRCRPCTSRRTASRRRRWRVRDGGAPAARRARPRRRRVRGRVRRRGGGRRAGAIARPREARAGAGRGPAGRLRGRLRRPARRRGGSPRGARRARAVSRRARGRHRAAVVRPAREVVRRRGTRRGASGPSTRS